MAEHRHVASSRSSRSAVPRELNRLQSQQDSLHTRVLELRSALEEKEQVLKSQVNTIKLYEFKFSLMNEQNTALRKGITVLSEYITEKLKAELPVLPEVPQEQGLRREDFGSFAGLKKKQRRKKSPRKLVSHSFSAVLPQDGYANPHIFGDFTGADFLKAILEAQMNRKMFQKSSLFLLSGKNKEVLLQPTQTALFQSLSFFLTCRNVAFLNNYDVFFPRVLQMLIDLLEVDLVTLYEKDPATGKLFSRATTGFSKYQLAIPTDFGHFNVLFKVKGTVVIANAGEDSNFNPEYHRSIGLSVKNLACVPLCVTDDIFGVLECVNKRHSFSPADLIVLNHVAKQISVGMMGIAVKDKVQRLVGKGSRLLESIDSSQDALLMPLIHTQLQALTTAVQCERATLFTYDAKSHELVSLLGTSLDGIIRLPLTKSIASAVFNTKKVVNLGSAEEHPEFLGSIDEATGFRTREILAMSVGSQGVLECLNAKAGRPFSESEVETAQAAAQVFNTLLDTMKNLSGILLESDLSEISLQHLQVAVLHINLKALIQKVNRFACEFLSLSSERLVGMALSELLEDTPKVLSKLVAGFDSAEITTVQSVAISTSRDDLKRHREAMVTLTLVPVTGRSPGFILLIYPLLQPEIGNL